jgi:hypothetical protein
LFQAQQNADELFHAVEKQGLIRANVLETQLNQDIYDLAKQMFGISTHWHKRIVRAGRNKLAPHDENPPDCSSARTIRIAFNGHKRVFFLFYREQLPNTEALPPLCPSLGNNTQIPAKDRSHLRIRFEHGVHSAMPPDTSIL